MSKKSFLAVAILGATVLLFVGCSDPPDPYTPAEYEQWRVNMQATMGKYSRVTQVKFEPFQSGKLIRVDMRGLTKRNAMDVSSAVAESFTATFPKARPFWVDVYDYDSMGELYSGHYKR